ncbi:hypothetical protein CapIbe_001866 [Capra ibex]
MKRVRWRHGHALSDGGHRGRGLTRQVCQVKAHQRVHPGDALASSQSGRTSLTVVQFSCPDWAVLTGREEWWDHRAP